jgi:hypothetical protein
MAYDKYVSLSCAGYELTNMRGVTETKVSEEIDSDLIKTFDDPIPVPASDGGFTIDVSVIATRNVEDFITLKKIILAMKKREGTISIMEIHRRKDGDVTEEQHFSGCLLSSNESTINAEDLTARDLSFKAKSQVEKINGVEIKVD